MSADHIVDANKKEGGKMKIEQALERHKEQEQREEEKAWEKDTDKAT